jgi:dTDP-4-dehydro-6-deoxy-alpha-D-glucopyranose 2,3-dehydratase
MNNIGNIHFDFLKSALEKKEISSVVKWIYDQNQSVNVNIKKVPFAKLDKWFFDKTNGNLKHETGKFFSIDGIKVKTTWGDAKEWDQPIINQPEIGFLGFIVKEIDGIFHFLVQAKIEPGNVNYVQLSPTLQATRSNYQQTHGGKKPLYLEYFQNATKEQILLDQLQSEQGARFLRKRNRNIIIKVDDEIEIYSNFIWLTLGQLKALMQLDNIVNMDTRTVISGIPFGSFTTETIDFFNYLNKSGDYQTKFLKSALIKDSALHSIEEIITFMTQIKSINDLEVKHIPLQDMEDWIVTDFEIKRKDEKYFKIIGVEVEIGNREVVKWSQPMVEPAQEGLCAFVCKEIDGVLHFAVQAKLECGNHDIVEFAPTIQTLTGDYKQTPKNSLPFLDYVLNASKEKIYFDTLQSEEGGRFFKEQNRNMIIVAGDEISDELPANFIWMTLNQLYVFIKFNNHLNIQARNLIATISFV